MKRRSIFLALLSVAAIVFFVGANTANAQTYSGQGTGVRVTVNTPPLPVLTTAVADTGPLPSAGGDITITSAAVNIPNILTVGDATVNTSGGGLTSQSLASVNTLNVGILNGLTLTADVVSSTTSCTCPARTCTGTSTVANLTITDANGNVTVINGTAAPNTTITIFGLGGLVIGTVVVNEQIVSPGSLTVNAIHVNLTIAGVNTDVIVASAHSDITCFSPPVINFYSGRATGIRNRDRTILNTDITTIVADTGFLPTSGGAINVTTVGAALPVLPLTSGTITSNTYGGVLGAPTTDVNSSASDSTVENLFLSIPDILPGPPLLVVSATTVHSETRCTCTLGISTCTGDSNLVNLAVLVLGIPIAIDLDFPPNQTLVLPLGLGTITINEQLPIPAANDNITVNALHLKLNVLGLALSDTIIASSHSDIDCGLNPSAANVSVSGRVRDSRGRGIARVNITTTDERGATRRVTTNSFGYYTFEELPAGQTYIFNASHKLYRFEPRVVSIDDNLTDLDFTPVNNGKRVVNNGKR